jgi:hypothetical protein
LIAAGDAEQIEESRVAASARCWIAPDPAYYWVHDARVTEGNIRILFYYESLDATVTPPSPLAATQPDRIYRWVIIPPAAASLRATLPLQAGPDAVLAELEEPGFEVG